MNILFVCSRITAKAYALREARQKEREAFVADAYDRQWRDSCDDARALDSQALTQFMNSQRAVQIEEKIKLKQQLSVAENSFLIEWKRQAAQAEEQEIALEQARLSANDKNTRLLSEQVSN